MPPVDKPNYTQIPNAILDNMPSMTMPEFSVVMAICRQTFGWHKKSEKLSVAQLQALTGFSKHTVLDALDAALRDGWIMRKPAGQTYRYTVNVQERTCAANAPLPHMVVQETHRYTKSTGASAAPVSSAANAPELVQQTRRYTPVLKKEKETNYKESNTRVEESARVVQPKTPPAPAVTIWHELTGLQPNQSQTNLIAQTVTDCELWRIRLTEWLANGYKPASVSSQLDVYANGWQTKRGQNGRAPAQAADAPAFRPLATLIVQEQS